ncbi:MAG: hypothetical protein ACR2P0_11745 [Acidimicrobiales bacterium]
MNNSNIAVLADSLAQRWVATRSERAVFAPEDETERRRGRNPGVVAERARADVTLRVEVISLPPR